LCDNFCKAKPLTHETVGIYALTGFSVPLFPNTHILGQDPDALLAMADKVAADVQAIIIKEPAYARFLRAHAHLTKDQWDTLASQLGEPQDKK
jgi:hypothetical protein